mgnify:CR=1 FL=1
MKPLFFKTDIFEKVLNVYWKRNEVISQNISNVNTPGYKAKRVVFEENFKHVLGRKRLDLVKTDEKHLSGIDNKLDYKIIEDSYKSIRNDKNNVDIDREMALLVKNHLKYNALIQLSSKELKRLKDAITGGRR